MRRKILLLLSALIACAGAMAQDSDALVPERTEFHGVKVEGSAAEIRIGLEKAGFAFSDENGKFSGKDFGYDVEVSLLADEDGNVHSIAASQKDALGSQEAADRYNSIIQSLKDSQYSPDLGAEFVMVGSAQELEEAAANDAMYNYRATYYQNPSWYDPSDPGVEELVKQKMMLYLKPLLDEEKFSTIMNEGAESLSEGDQLVVGLGALAFVAEHLYCRPMSIELLKEDGGFRISVSYDSKN